MDAIEKRARELLDAELRKLGLHEDAHHVGCGADLDRNDQAAINAIAVAITPPEGYVLVEEAQLRHLLSDAITSVEFIAGRGQSKPLSRRVSNQAWALVELIPARRKVT